MMTGSNANIQAPAIATLKKRSDFLRVKGGTFARRSAFILQAKKDPDLASGRVGYTVTKKTGNSVERNRIRRRLREAVRLGFAGKALANHDYVLVGKPQALSQDFAELTLDIRKSLDQVHVKSTKPQRQSP